MALSITKHISTLTRRTLLPQRLTCITKQQERGAKKKSSKDKTPGEGAKQPIPEKKPFHPEQQIDFDHFPNKPKGRIADKLPFKVFLEEGKIYSWCTCGVSHTQPFCDGSHKKVDRSIPGIKETFQYKPFRFKVEESKEYWLCRCKQTDNKPFCDGTHQQPFVKNKKIILGIE